LAIAQSLTGLIIQQRESASYQNLYVDGGHDGSQFLGVTTLSSWAWHLTITVSLVDFLSINVYQPGYRLHVEALQTVQFVRTCGLIKVPLKLF
jgi:hypothetical protein